MTFLSLSQTCTCNTVFYTGNKASWINMIMKLNWKKCFAGILCLIGFLLLLVKINQFEKRPLVSTYGQTYEKAVVTEITKDNLAEDGNRYGTQEVRVYLKTGKLAGGEFDAVNPGGSLFGADCTVGSKVIVIVSATDDNAIVTVYSQDRTMAIYLFALIFAGIVCLTGGKKGVKAIASLGLLGGISAKTASAIIGTTFGVIIAALAAWLFGRAAGITGYNVLDIETLNYVAQNSQIRIGSDWQIQALKENHVFFTKYMVFSMRDKIKGIDNCKKPVIINTNI